MGFAPPKDAPPPDEQASASANIGFEPAPTGAALCGFGFPSFTFGLSFVLPKFPPFPFPFTFNYFVAFNCDLSNPISANFGFGGGHQTVVDPDSDPEYGEGLSTA